MLIRTLSEAFAFITFLGACTLAATYILWLIGRRKRR